MKIRQILVNIASANQLRRFYYAVSDRYSDALCKRFFVDAMNRKSEALGLTQSRWINPSGLGENGVYSQSTARDLALLGVAAWRYEQLQEIWTQKIYEMSVTKSYVWHPHMHTIRRMGSTIEENFVGCYPILGGKTGAGDDFYTLILITSIEKIGYVAGAIMQATSLENRFEAMHELFDVVRGKRIGVESAKCACAYLIPSANAKNTPPVCLFAQNADEPSAPMSTSKLLTLMVALDSGIDIKQEVIIKPFDIKGTEGTSGSVFKVWEKVKLEDLFYAALLPSSNQAANAIAREVGYQLLLQSNGSK